MIHCCVQTGLLSPDVLQPFRLALGFAACFLKCSWHLLFSFFANWSLHSPFKPHDCSTVTWSCVDVCDQRMTLSPTERDWLCKTSLYSQLGCSNFIEAAGKVALKCVVSPCCTNIHVVSAQVSDNAGERSALTLCFFSYQSWQLICRFSPWHNVAVQNLTWQASLTLSSYGDFC